MNRSDLHPYQHKAIEFIKAQRRCALFLDMGLGKTASTLTALADLLAAKEIKKALVIAPLRVANGVWVQEVKKWSHLSHLKINIATGTAQERREALRRKADIYVINRENIVWLLKLSKGKWPFDALVIDESSGFKSPSAKRFRAVKKVAPLNKVVVLLTGTPSPNGLMDLWAQLYLLDEGACLGRTITVYRQRFFDTDYWGFNWIPKPSANSRIHKLISDRGLALSMQSDDYLQLPDRIDVIERVTLPHDIMMQYLDFKKTLFLEFQGAEIEAMSAAVLGNKLLQFANGAIYTGDSGNWAHIHDAKMDALEEIIEENAGENILISYTYRHDLARLQKRFPTARLLDAKGAIIDEWNKGKVPLLLAHPASCGHGINLQGGGAMLIWFGLSWNLEHDLQMNARLHRQGQKRPVRIVRIVTKGTIDERVLGVLDNKNRTQNDLLRALKAEM
jgi:SNF2 family DNA or RNA helicase